MVGALAVLALSVPATARQGKLAFVGSTPRTGSAFSSGLARVGLRRSEAVVVRSSADEEVDAEDKENLRLMREQLMSMNNDELKMKVNYNSQEDAEPQYWARKATREERLDSGVVLLANPEIFCAEDAPTDLLEHCALARQVPNAEELDPDSRANVLPVILILGETEDGGHEGLLLNRRTGYLMGDLKQDVSGFRIQPLNFGGSKPSEGISFLHPYEIFPDTLPVGDGLYWGGEFADAQQLVKDGSCSQFRFKFFIQTMAWGPGQLQNELDSDCWLPAKCSPDVILKVRDPEGRRRPKPIWTDVMELSGDVYGKMARALYSAEL